MKGLKQLIQSPANNKLWDLVCSSQFRKSLVTSWSQFRTLHWKMAKQLNDVSDARRQCLYYVSLQLFNLFVSCINRNQVLQSWTTCSFPSMAEKWKQLPWGCCVTGSVLRTKWERCFPWVCTSFIQPAFLFHEYDQTTFVASGSFFLCDQSSRVDSMLVAGLYIWRIFPFFGGQFF